MTTTTATAAPAAVIPLVRPGVQCTVCHLPPDQRRAVEADLGTTASIRAVASRHGLHREAVRRHLRGHLGPEVRAHLERTGRLSALGVAARLAELADAAADVRNDAEERGDNRMILRAIDAEGRTLATISDRLGLPGGQALSDLADARALVAAVGVVASRSLEFADAIADELDAANAHALAVSVRRIAREEHR